MSSNPNSQNAPLSRLETVFTLVAIVVALGALFATCSVIIDVYLNGVSRSA